MDRPIGSDAGFSLIELMVAVAILAVLAVGVTVVAGRSTSPFERDVARFQRAFETQSALAIHGAQRRGLRITPLGMRTARHENGRWVWSDNSIGWDTSVSVSVQDPVIGAPDIVFLANGQNSRFDVVFASARRCQSDGWTGLTCD